MRVQPRKFFCFISKIQLSMNFFNETSQIFQFFFPHVFSTWRILNKQWKIIGLQRRDLKLQSCARIKSIRKKRGKCNSFYTAGSIGPPVTVPLFFGGVTTQVNSVLRHQKRQRSAINSFWIFFQRKLSIWVCFSKRFLRNRIKFATDIIFEKN